MLNPKVADSGAISGLHGRFLSELQADINRTYWPVPVGLDGRFGRNTHILTIHNAERVDTGGVGVAGKIPLTDATRKLIPSELFHGGGMVLGQQGKNMFLAVYQFGTAPDTNPKNSGSDSIDVGEDDTQDYIMWAFSAQN